MTTKTIELIELDETALDTLLQEERLCEIQKQVAELSRYIPEMQKSFQNIAEKQFGWLHMDKKDVYYHTGISAIVPNLANFKLGHCNTKSIYDTGSFRNEFCGFTGRLPKTQEIIQLFRGMHLEVPKVEIPPELTEAPPPEPPSTKAKPKKGFGGLFSSKNSTESKNTEVEVPKLDSDDPPPLTKLGILLLKQFHFREIKCFSVFSSDNDSKVAESTVNPDGQPLEDWGKIVVEYEEQRRYYMGRVWETYWTQADNCVYSTYYDLRRTGNTRVGNQESYHLPVFPLHPPKSNAISGHLFRLLQEGVYPSEFTQDQKKICEKILELMAENKNILHYTDGKINLVPEEIAKQQKINEINGNSFQYESIKERYLQTLPLCDPKAEELLRRNMERDLLYCEQIRADLEPYHKKILTDPNGGHWDLWNSAEVPTGKIPLKLDLPVVGRNPLADVRENGIIGIDFGTKSTVVVFQEDSEQTLPLRIGTGKLSKKIAPSHYENPTVLEFVDLESFLTAYNAKECRPNTTWEQVTTSHTAFNNFLQSNSDQYYSFLYELKQWAGDKQRKIHLRDKKNKDVLLEPYLQLEEGDFDPVEIYAYYLGLYINNMHNGIYIDYLLSYPVAYEKEARDRILASFSRGIKKSLPEPVLKDEKTMKFFSVTLGASEPVAYAICALEEYGFDPRVGEEIFYAVFDFGGGTTDFDFGIFRGVDEDKYDFVVESFGSSGDQFLGGENLLELLSFESFKKNQDLLRDMSITFEKPTECKRFAGDELLIANTQEAKLNMAQLKEKLRTVWERHSGYQEDFETGILKVNLFDKNGNLVPNLNLEISLEELEDILYTRIETGVSNFFQSLLHSLEMPKNTRGFAEINILLAGSSSKSAILREVMDRYIAKYNKILSFAPGVNKIFNVFPPLGTKESEEYFKSIEKKAKPRSVESPTCKTGVAFGLVGSREGSRIQLIRETDTSEETKFPFYIGKERRGKFNPVTEPMLKFGQWVKFTDASQSRFTLYFSRLPSVASGQTAIKDVERRLCRLEDTYPEANIYFRAVTPMVIEYVVSKEENLATEAYETEPVQLILEEPS